ncbi:glycosyltransferase [Vibrio chemaguriensis]
MKKERINWFYNGTLTKEEQDGHSVVNVNLIKKLLLKDCDIDFFYISTKSDAETEVFVTSLGVKNVTNIKPKGIGGRLANLIFPKKCKSKVKVVYGSNAVMDHVCIDYENTILIAGDVESRKWVQNKKPTTFHNYLINKSRESRYRKFSSVVIYNDVEAQFLNYKSNLIINPVCYNGYVKQNTEVDIKYYDIIFTGNFSYQPNLDAAKYLINEFSRGPYKLALVGFNADLLGEVKSDYIIIKDSVPSVEDELDKAKIFISPLRYGTGVKNKVLSAINVGIPIIATNVSIEGIPDIHNFSSVMCSYDRKELINLVEKTLSDYDFYKEEANKTKDYYDALMSWESFAEILNCKLRDKC